MDTNTAMTFNQLVDTHSAEIYAYLWRMLRSESEASDCLQDTFLRAFQAFPRLEPGSNHRAWIYKIATNVAYTALNRSMREKQRVIEFDPKLHKDRIDIEVEFVRNETLAEVLREVEKLPPKQRAALMMHKYQGFSYKEISQILECQPSAARANVYQALSKLRTLFSEREV
jgi:RNA polymerase sigma-70 factor (ECF subfamily)